MKCCYFMVGLPASGKSTYIEQNSLDGEFVISTDNYIESQAKAEGKTYDEMFQRLIKAATKHENLRVQQIIKVGENFWWDQTNLTKKSRKNKLLQLKNYGYDVHCIYFVKPDDEHLHTTWRDRLNSREGKTIPDQVLISMLNNMETPEFSEGFATIQTIDTFSDGSDDFSLSQEYIDRFEEV